MGFYGAFYSDGEISICMEHMVCDHPLASEAWELGSFGLIFSLRDSGVMKMSETVPALREIIICFKGSLKGYLDM